MADDTVIKHFVTFFSPGTFVSEETTKPIETWNVEEACAMAREIKERHAAVPYAFRFATRTTCSGELDSKTTETSNIYYLGGKVETLEEITARKDPRDQILIGNMLNNNITKIIVNTNSWVFRGALRETDVILPFEMKPEKA